MIQWLLAKTEGENTFWGKTAFERLQDTHIFKTPVYRENKGKVEVLQAYTEGPNTFWDDFDPFHNSVEKFLKGEPPLADSRTVLRVRPA